MVLQIPEPTKEPRQRSINKDDIYLSRYITPWTRPYQPTAETWRWWVFNEPIAMICRETLIANILALDWEITPRKSEDREELKAVIRYYTRLLEKGGDYHEGFDWTNLIEWIMTDLQDLSFGGAAEIGRKNDSPTGRVIWIKPLDGGTLYPTLNRDFPIIQYYQNYDIVTFPKHAIARTYMSPRPEIMREGWGLAPPEKVYFALMMLYQGDKYYADLLLDNPPAGILDLGDMEADSALEWAEAYRNFLIGKSTAFKIPVLYEHTTDTKFISFGKVPNDIMFDRITLKYAAIVAAAYGMSLSDIGLQATSASGQTLAGSIRDERKTKRTGFARIKKKIKYFIESFLPDILQFNFIDLDDEISVGLGRARLATITALSQAIDKGVMSAPEVRLVLLNDGLLGTTTLPEEPPPDAKPLLPAAPFGKSPERPGTLGKPESASEGGQGEVRLSTVKVVRSANFDSHFKKLISGLTRDVSQIIEESRKVTSDDEIYLLRSMVDESLFSEEDVLGILQVIKSQWEGKRWFKLSTKGLAKELEDLAILRVEELAKERYENSYDEYDLEEDIERTKSKLGKLDWNNIATEFESVLSDGVKMFLGKSAVYLVKSHLLSEDTFDDDSKEGYDLTDEVYRMLLDNLETYVSVSVGMQAETLINKIEEMIEDV